MSNWTSEISIEACEQLRTRYGPDLTEHLNFGGETVRPQEVTINGVIFFVGVVEEGWYFTISTPLDSRRTLYHVWGPASLVGALSLMGVKRVAIDEMLEALISARW